ncbi:MmgE/PrpD family protein [Frigidibacter sp. MR17.14]|uniref:MmgE/PrpD family protein n=1 Tax=Frigidibacter sp. MR17.14 TaxID=3126509 RepID=UPI003013149D
MAETETRADQGTTLDRVAAFALNLAIEDIPSDVLARMAVLMLDTLGVGAAAVGMEAGRIARETALALYGAGPGGWSAPMLFDGRIASTAGAAFALASQIDNLDAHDGYNPTKGHTGVAIFPALLALAGRHPAMSGPAALAAATVGYEIAGRAATALHATVGDYHTSGAWNALGVAAMAARIEGMGPATLREALGIAEFHGPRSQMMREIATPTMLHDGSGMGALIGISAAVMAGLGFTGAPAVTVEAPEVAGDWADLGRHWQVPLYYIKPYPVCRWAHAAIDGTRAIRLAHRLDPDRIAAIEVESFAYAADLFAGLPETSSKAQYGLPFAVAVMAVHGEIGVGHITGAGLTDARVIEMLKRVSVTASARFTDRYPAERRAEVTIRTTDGAVLRSGDIHARGGPEAPMAEAEILEKYHRYADPVLGETRARAIHDAVLGLTAPGARLADLLPLLTEGVAA